MPAAEPPGAAADLALIRDAAGEAGAIAMRHFRRDPEVWLKNGRSPVSQADIDVDNHLRDLLLRARPGYGWLSEETEDNDARLGAARTFVVDPIDGTRAFLEGHSTWGVSIAVVENGRSIAGVLECPARKQSFTALRGGGAMRDGLAISVRSPGATLDIAGPKPMVDMMPAALLDRTRRYRYVPSLAYRIALVASGEIDATYVKPDSHDWDLAAVDLLLEEAGGAVLDTSGQRLRYAGPTPRHGALAVGSGALLSAMLAAIAPQG